MIAERDGEARNDETHLNSKLIWRFVDGEKNFYFNYQ